MWYWFVIISRLIVILFPDIFKINCCWIGDIFRFLNMSTVKVPPGWIRKKVGKKIAYITDPPKVSIWKISEFDAFKKKGRFSTIPREMLNFSIKVRRNIWYWELIWFNVYWSYHYSTKIVIVFHSKLFVNHKHKHRQLYVSQFIFS